MLNRFAVAFLIGGAAASVRHSPEFTTRAPPPVQLPSVPSVRWIVGTTGAVPDQVFAAWLLIPRTVSALTRRRASTGGDRGNTRSAGARRDSPGSLATHRGTGTPSANGRTDSVVITVGTPAAADVWVSTNAQSCPRAPPQLPGEAPVSIRIVIAASRTRDSLVVVCVRPRAVGVVPLVALVRAADSLSRAWTDSATTASVVVADAPKSTMWYAAVLGLLTPVVGAVCAALGFVAQERVKREQDRVDESRDLMQKVTTEVLLEITENDKKLRADLTGGFKAQTALSRHAMLVIVADPHVQHYLRAVRGPQFLEYVEALHREMNSYNRLRDRLLTLRDDPRHKPEQVAEVEETLRARGRELQTQIAAVPLPTSP